MINYNRKLSNKMETQDPSQRMSILVLLYVSFVLFYEQYLTTTAPDSKLNYTAIGIFTLYALMDSSFWIETIGFGRSIVYINGSG